MKKIIILFIMSIISINIYADDNKGFKKDGNTYTAINSSTGRQKSDPIPTQFQWVDVKGVSYPIFVSSTGSCFIIKISKKTGKEYRSYLGPEISQDICKQLDIEYKGKKK